MEAAASSLRGCSYSLVVAQIFLALLLSPCHREEGKTGSMESLTVGSGAGGGFRFLWHPWVSITIAPRSIVKGCGAHDKSLPLLTPQESWVDI